MAKLYPPNIAGTLPAFFGESFSIPFSHNRAVSTSEISGYTLKMKTIQSNKIVAIDVQGVESADGLVTFTFDEENRVQPFNIGQSYKVQIAYISNDGEEGYFSTVGVVKYTAEPEVLINNSNSSQIHEHAYNYIGSYKNTDLTEKLYSYQFILKDNINNIILDSGTLIHDGREDENGVAICQFNINQELDQNIVYNLIFSTTSINGLTKKINYKIEQGSSINPELKADLVADLNYENGYVDLHLIGEKVLGSEKAVTGTFKISRAENTDNYKTWNEVVHFALYGQQPSLWSWKDMTVKQGVTYKYAFQQYNNTLQLTSNRVESNSVYVDFEHVFLYDGNRQLKIKFNPQINSFKNDILESKLDTIGNQYPFIFRNGHIKYKEFPIGGLISVLLDDEYLFQDQDVLINHDQTVNLIDTNIAVEREFKLEVLEWLNNGQPKIFRSPSEGNYIIRLLNVSLSPVTTLGRMLHTFTATAYEVMEWNYFNLKENNFFPLADPILQQLYWETKDLTSLDADALSNNLLNYMAASIHLEGLIPGDQMKIGYYTDLTYSSDSYKEEEFIIGATGNYILDLSLGLNIVSLKFLSPSSHQGMLTYSYYSRVIDKFDKIHTINTPTYPIEQFVGEHDNILNNIQDIKTEVLNIYLIKGILRELQPVYQDADVYYIDAQLSEKLADSDEINSPYYIFKAYVKNQEGIFVADHYYDGFNDKTFSLQDYSPYIYLDNISISLLEKNSYELKNPKLFTSISTGNGVILEIAYRLQDIEYTIESDTSKNTLMTLKENYISAKDEIKNLIHPSNPNYDNDWEASVNKWSQLKEKLETYNEAKEAYMSELKQELEQMEVE